jgi:cysteine desulfurase
VIYLDYQATTPLAPEAAEAMRPWLDTHFANPHSPSRLGREAAAAIEVARERVLKALETPLPEREGPGVGASEASPDEGGGELRSPRGKLYFTSGATEAANWALKGAAARLPQDRRRIVTLATEHAAVLDTAQWLAGQGIDVEILPVETDGLLDLPRLEEALRTPTGLVAAMLVNNEIGVIQPVGEISRLARDAGAIVFCDAVQALGRVSVPLDCCDMVAVSAHKVHGPKGIGALWLREGVGIDPLIHGGGQEGGLRSGTLSPALCVGFGEAARLLVERAEEDRAHVERLWALARDILRIWELNGSAERRYRGNINLRLEGVDSARLLSENRAVAFSSGSACASGSGRPSHVLRALGLSEAQARSSIRLGFGRYTTEKQLADALEIVAGRALLQLDEAW